MAHHVGLRSARTAAVIGALLLTAGCASVAPAENIPAGGNQSTTEETPSEQNSGERIDYTGSSEAQVVYEGVLLRFEADGSGDNGSCVQTRDGMLNAELHLVEIDGAAHNGAGSNPELVLEVPLSTASTDERGGAHLLFAGGWVAGDTVYNVSRVDTPDITLVAEGATISGTQKLVATTPLGSARDVEMEVTLQCR